MRQACLVLALLSIATIATADHHAGGAAKMTPGTYPERAAPWKRFTVKDLQLGSEIDKIPGFTCDAKVGGYRHTCVRFLDEKCKGRKTYVKSISFSSDVPPGQGCTYDSSTGGTYLDRKPTTTPLQGLALVGTDTDVPRAYEIRYIFAKDVVSADSNIGKAMIAKYGKPDFVNEPIQMRWNTPGIDDLFLVLECGGTQGPTGDYCLIQVYDGPLLDSERSIKQDFEAKKTLSIGPAAPKL